MPRLKTERAEQHWRVLAVALLLERLSTLRRSRANGHDKPALLGANSSPNATSDAISSAPSGLGILSSLHDVFADAAKGNGLIIAFVLSLASTAIGICVALDINPRRFLKLAIGLSLAYWVIGQGLGGIFTGTATDPNTGLVFVLLALALWPLHTGQSTATSAYR